MQRLGHRQIAAGDLEGLLTDGEIEIEVGDRPVELFGVELDKHVAGVDARTVRHDPHDLQRQCPLLRLVLHDSGIDRIKIPLRLEDDLEAPLLRRHGLDRLRIGGFLGRRLGRFLGHRGRRAPCRRSAGQEDQSQNRSAGPAVRRHRSPVAHQRGPSHRVAPHVRLVGRRREPRVTGTTTAIPAVVPSSPRLRLPTIRQRLDQP